MFRWSRSAMLSGMPLPSWVPGEETKPAPMPLLLVQSFVNTWDGDHGSDLLLDPAAAHQWLTKAGLWNADREPDPAELDLARRLREAVRRPCRTCQSGCGSRCGARSRWLLARW